MKKGMTTTNVDMEHFRAELHQGLMGEMRNQIMEQMKALSANLMEEVRTQLYSGSVPQIPTT